MSILLRCRGKKRSLFDLSPTIYKDSVYYWGCGSSQYLGHSLEQGERGCSFVGSHSKNLWGFLHVFKWGTTNLFALCYPYNNVLLCPSSMNNLGRFVVSLQIIWWQQLSCVNVIWPSFHLPVVSGAGRISSKHWQHGLLQFLWKSFVFGSKGS